MKRRVAITGIGAVSPNGIGRERFWEATRLGVSGIRRISAFDASPYTVSIAGQIADFNEDEWVAPKDRPHVGRVVPLAVSAAKEAIEDAGLEPERMNRDELRRIGVMV